MTTSKALGRTAMVAIAVSLFCVASFGFVFDDAKVWWKFDAGGADGAVATKSQIKDARDGVTTGVPTNVRGQDGGPTWTNTTVTLANRRKTVDCTALDFTVATRDNNGTAQNWPDGMTFNNVAATTDSVTFFARIRPGVPLRGLSTTAYYCLYNNIFTWGSAADVAFGHFFGLKFTDGAYHPFFYIGRKDMTFSSLSLSIGKWYDYAISVTLQGDQYKVLCVVCGEQGTTFQTFYVPFARTGGNISGTSSNFGGQGTFTGWQTTDGNWQSKNYNGLLHEFAVWERALTFDEILDAFGRQAEKDDEDPYADADYWWKFDRDIDGDGSATADEIRGVRTWGMAAAAGAGNPVVSHITPDNSPKWRARDVLMAARGETVSTDCLSFEPEWRELESGEKQVRPAQMNFGTAAMAGSMTVFARLRLTSDFTTATEQFLYNNAFKYATDTTQGGRLFGFIKSGGVQTFVPRIFAGRRYTSASSIPMKTNTWYDIAYTYAPGTDEEGVDMVSVVVADDEHGVRTWSGTIPTNQFCQAECNVRIGGQSGSDTWAAWQGADGKDTAGGAWRKMFGGDLHELAVWNRALSTDEILLAMGWPRALFGAGTADGTSGEFAPSGSGSYDAATGTPWHDVAGTLDSSHRTLTVRFVPPLNWNGMPQAFRLRPAAVGNGTQTARLAFSVNGNFLGEEEVATGVDTWWWIGGTHIAAGENALTLTLKSGDPAVAIDKMDISGSWAAVSVSGDAFPQENDTTSKDFYVGDRRMAHITRAVTASPNHKKNRLHFWMPPELAARYEFHLTFNITNCGTDGTFKMNLNGVSQGSWASLQNKGKTIELVFEPGALLGGWNVIEPEQTAGWTQFSFYRLKMRDPNSGFTVVIK